MNSTSKKTYLKYVTYAILSIAVSLSMVGCQAFEEAQRQVEEKRMRKEEKKREKKQAKERQILAVEQAKQREAAKRTWIAESGMRIEKAIAQKSKITPQLLNDISLHMKSINKYFYPVKWTDAEIVSNEHTNWVNYLCYNLARINTYDEYIDFCNLYNVCHCKNMIKKPQINGGDESKDFNIITSNGYCSMIETRDSIAKKSIGLLSKELGKSWGDSIVDVEKRVISKITKEEIELLKSGKYDDFRASYLAHQTCNEQYFNLLLESPTEELGEFLLGNIHMETGTPAYLRRGWFLIESKLNSLFSRYFKNEGDVLDALPVAAFTGNGNYIDEHLKKADFEAEYFFNPVLYHKFGRRMFNDENMKRHYWIFSNIAHVKRQNPNDEIAPHCSYSLLELALIGGHVEIANKLYDTGARDPKNLVLKTGFCRADIGMKIIDWAISNMKISPQQFYEVALRVNNVDLAQMIENKFTNVRPRLLFEDYFAAIALGENNAVRTAEYLLNKGVLIMDKERGYSALAKIGERLWEDRFALYNVLKQEVREDYKAFFAVMRVLVEKGADVNIHAVKYRKRISETDAAMINDIVRSCADNPLMIKSYKEQLGINDVIEMENLIKFLESLQGVEFYKGNTPFDQYAFVTQYAPLMVEALAGNEVIGDTSDYQLRKVAKERLISTEIGEVMAKHKKINLQKVLDQDCPPLAAAILSGDLGLVKLFVGKGAELPCVVKVTNGNIELLNVNTISKDIKNYLRVAERKQRMKDK